MADARVQEDSKILMGTTPGGKEIYYARSKNNSHRCIEFGSGGQLPKQLHGMFTSPHAAQAAVLSYLARVEAKDIGEDGEDIKRGKKNA